VARKSESRHWTLLPGIEFLVYAAVRMALTFLQILSSLGERRLGHRVGVALRLFDRKHARILAKNLKRVEHQFRPSAHGHFTEQLYGHLGRTAVELALVPRRLSRSGESAGVALERFEILDEALSKGRGAILAVGHTGNYELAGLAIALRGYRLNSLARPIVNRRLDHYLTNLRARTGQILIRSHGAVPAMLAVLKRNEVLAVEIDVDAKAEGIVMDFIGAPASMHRSPAVLSLRRGAPVIVADVHRVNGRNRCVLSDPIRPEAFTASPDAVRALTARIAEEFERIVRARPEQWWWILDRWRGAEKLLLQKG
jgi:Kdo2-lipid IVA lauroyltransferase/acyltransferase